MKVNDSFYSLSLKNVKAEQVKVSEYLEKFINTCNELFENVNFGDCTQEVFLELANRINDMASEELSVVSRELDGIIEEFVENVNSQDVLS